MTAPVPPRLGGLDLTEITWRGRAIRYVVIYLALAVALVAVRALTQDIRPTLRAAQDREAALLTGRNDLAVRVQTLENPQRIRDWAFAGGMIRFAEAPKETQAIAPLPPPPEAAAAAGSVLPDSSGPPDSSLAPALQPANPEPRNTGPGNTGPGNTVPDNTVEVRTQWK